MTWHVSRDLSCIYLYMIFQSLLEDTLFQEPKVDGAYLQVYWNTVIVEGPKNNICKDLSKVDENSVGRIQVISQHFVMDEPRVLLLLSNFSFICHQRAFPCLYCTLWSLKGISRVTEKSQDPHCVIFPEMEVDTHLLSANVVLVFFVDWNAASIMYANWMSMQRRSLKSQGAHINNN